MEIADQKSAEEVARLEKAILDGGFEAIRPYVGDAIRHRAGDTKELERRKRFVAKNCQGVEEGVYCFALLTVLTDDRPGWDVASNFFGSNMPPSLGVLAYSYLKDAVSDKELLSRWHFLLEESQRSGHLQAHLILGKAKLDRYGFLGKVLTPVFGFLIWCKAAWMSLRNPQDDRLPFFLSQPAKTQKRSGTG